MIAKWLKKGNYMESNKKIVNMLNSRGKLSSETRWAAGGLSFFNDVEMNYFPNKFDRDDVFRVID